MPNPPSINHRLPRQQLIVADGTKALDPLLTGRLFVVPRVELLEQTADGVARVAGTGGGRGRHGWLALLRSLWMDALSIDAPLSAAVAVGLSWVLYPPFSGSWCATFSNECCNSMYSFR